MLLSLLNVPRKPEDWERYSFDLRNQTTITRQAIQKQSNGSIRLFEYQLTPIPPNDKDNWLSRLQQSLNDINQALNLQGNDVTGVDFNDPQQLEAWVSNLYLQYNAAAVALGI